MDLPAHIPPQSCSLSHRQDTGNRQKPLEMSGDYWIFQNLSSFYQYKLTDSLSITDLLYLYFSLLNYTTTRIRFYNKGKLKVWFVLGFFSLWNSVCQKFKTWGTWWRTVVERCAISASCISGSWQQRAEIQDLQNHTIWQSKHIRRSAEAESCRSELQSP